MLTFNKAIIADNVDPSLFVVTDDTGPISPDAMTSDDDFTAEAGFSRPITNLLGPVTWQANSPGSWIFVDGKTLDPPTTGVVSFE